MSNNKIKIGIINYGVGNLRSIHNAVAALGYDPIVTISKNELKECTCLILPGVGAFAYVMEKFIQNNVYGLIENSLQDRKLCLGVCVGHQLLFKESYEFKRTDGLNLFEGVVHNLNDLAAAQSKAFPLRLPNVNWLPVSKLKNKSNELVDSVFEGMSPETKYYFVHSYAASVHGCNNYYKSNFEGVEFAAVSAKDNFVGVQFHPEKSGKSGLLLLNNFIKAGIKYEK